MADYFIPSRVFRQMDEAGVSERDVDDVFNNGEHLELSGGLHLMKKKYEGWGELWLTYTRDQRNGQYVITKIGKRARR